MLLLLLRHFMRINAPMLVHTLRNSGLGKLLGVMRLMPFDISHIVTRGEWRGGFMVLLVSRIITRALLVRNTSLCQLIS